MTLAINFINTDHNAAIENFINSLVLKSFPDLSSIKDIIVNMQTQADARVPWKCTIHLFSSQRNLVTESQSANNISAFSQALTRLKQKWDKTAVTAA